MVYTCISCPNKRILPNFPASTHWYMVTQLSKYRQKYALDASTLHRHRLYHSQTPMGIRYTRIVCNVLKRDTHILCPVHNFPQRTGGVSRLERIVKSRVLCVSAMITAVSRSVARSKSSDHALPRNERRWRSCSAPTLQPSMLSHVVVQEPKIPYHEGLS